MNLTLVGLCLSFAGSILLVITNLMSLGKPRPYYSPANEELGCKAVKYEHQKDKFLKRVKYTKEEIILFIALALLSSGFLLQIFGFLCDK